MKTLHEPVSSDGILILRPHTWPHIGSAFLGAMGYDPVLGTKVWPKNMVEHFTSVMRCLFSVLQAQPQQILNDIKHSSGRSTQFCNHPASNFPKESEWYSQCRPAENTAALMEMPGLKPRAWADLLGQVDGFNMIPLFWYVLIVLVLYPCDSGWCRILGCAKVRNLSPVFIDVDILSY